MPQAPAPPPRTTPQSPWVGIALTLLLIPTIFWFAFGHVDAFALAFAGFFALLQLGIHFGARPASAPAAPPKFKRSPLDLLGVLWLLSIPFAPLAGWIITSTVELTPDNWRSWLTLRAILCVALPLFFVLGLLRFLRRPHLALGISILAIGTAFPIASGYAATRDLLTGPAWQSVTIADLRSVRFRHKSRTVNNPAVFVDLADGRTLKRPPSLALTRGPARLLILRHTERILAAEPASPQ